MLHLQYFTPAQPVSYLTSLIQLLSFFNHKSLLWKFCNIYVETAMEPDIFFTNSNLLIICWTRITTVNIEFENTLLVEVTNRQIWWVSRCVEIGETWNKETVRDVDDYFSNNCHRMHRPAGCGSLWLKPHDCHGWYTIPETVAVKHFVQHRKITFWIHC